MSCKLILANRDFIAIRGLNGCPRDRGSHDKKAELALLNALINCLTRRTECVMDTWIQVTVSGEFHFFYLPSTSNTNTTLEKDMNVLSILFFSPRKEVDKDKLKCSQNVIFLQQISSKTSGIKQNKISLFLFLSLVLIF